MSLKLQLPRANRRSPPATARVPGMLELKKVHSVLTDVYPDYPWEYMF